MPITNDDAQALLFRLLDQFNGKLESNALYLEMYVPSEDQEDVFKVANQLCDEKILRLVDRHYIHGIKYTQPTSNNPVTKYDFSSASITANNLQVGDSNSLNISSENAEALISLIRDLTIKKDKGLLEKVSSVLALGGKATDTLIKLATMASI